MKRMIRCHNRERDGYSAGLILRPEWRASRPREDVVVEINHKSKLIRISNKIVRIAR